MFFTPQIYNEEMYNEEIYNGEMYNPELLKLIERDNEETEPLLSRETLANLLDGVLIFMTISVIPYIIFGWLKAIAKIYWSWLTPGRQWYEILVTSMAVALVILGKLIIDELTNQLNRSFDSLKAEYEGKIKKLERESAVKDGKIADLEKKVNGPNNANNSAIDVNVINN